MSNDELAVWKKWNTAKIIHGVLQEAPACSQSCDVATSEFPAKQLLEHVGIWVDLNAAIAAKLPNAEYSFGIDNFDAEKNSIEQYIRAEWKTQLPFGYSHSEIKTENTSPAIIASIFPTDYFQSFKINTSSYIWGSPLTHPELKGREYHGFLLPKLKNNHNQRGEVNELYQGGSNPKSESHDKNTKIGASGKNVLLPGKFFLDFWPFLTYPINFFRNSFVCKSFLNVKCSCFAKKTKFKTFRVSTAYLIVEKV